MRKRIFAIESFELQNKIN